MLKVDMWGGKHARKFKPMKFDADTFFYPSGIAMAGSYYAGNIYDENGKTIGDYVCDDSVEIEQNFKIRWKG